MLIQRKYFVFFLQLSKNSYIFAIENTAQSALMLKDIENVTNLSGYNIKIHNGRRAEIIATSCGFPL